MSGPAPSARRSPPALLLPSGGWAHRLDGLCRALSHHLNGRANALSGLVEVLERGNGDEGITGHLRGEVDRVSRVAGLLRTVVGPTGEEEVVVLSRVVGDALALGSLDGRTPRLEPGRLELEADAAVRTDPVLLGRLLLLLRARLARRCGPVSVSVTLGEEAARACVDMSGVTQGDADAAGAPGAGFGEPAHPEWSELVAAAEQVPGVERLERVREGEGERYRLTLRRLE